MQINLGNITKIKTKISILKSLTIQAKQGKIKKTTHICTLKKN